MKTFDPDALSQSMAEPSRRAILENLRHGQKSVTELVNSTSLKQPNVSNHLAKMRMQGIVRAERIGRQVFYSLATPYAEVVLRLHEAAAHPLHNGHTFNPSQSSSPITHHPGGEENSDAHSGTGDPLSSALDEWKNAYYLSLMQVQEDRAVSLVNAMLAERLSLEVIYTQVFQWALEQIGERYVQGEINEAQEHIASAITERMLARVAQFYSPLSRVGYRAVLGCVAGNWHTLGLRMLADGLRALGWDAMYIGANVPTSSFLETVTISRPDLVIISCTIEEQLPETKHLVQRLVEIRATQDNQTYKIIVGGHITHTKPDILHELSVDFTSHDLSEFLAVIRTHFPDTPTPRISPSEKV